MNTKEVCNRLSVTPKMLRIYERQKLICAERSENNYRNYSIDDLLQIQIIVMLRNLGFSLKEVKKVLDYKKTKNDYLYHFYIQLKAVESKINGLYEMKKQLNDTINMILSEEEVNEEFLYYIYAYQRDHENNIYENMVVRWNFDQMAVNYVNRYLKEDLGYLKSIRRTEAILKELVVNKKVLDIGGGPCNLWINFPGDTKLTVMDNSLQMIFVAKENISWANFILDDIIRLNTKRSETYDIVVSTFTLHHISYKQQEKAIKNMLDLCSVGGCVIIVDRSFRDQLEKEKKEKEFEEGGNTEFLDIIRSEFYLIADYIIRYIHILDYPVSTLFFEDQIWGFRIDKIQDEGK